MDKKIKEGLVKKDEIEIILTQIFGNFGFLIAALLSIIVSLDLYCEKTTGKPLLEKGVGENIEKFNRLFLLVIIVVLFFNSIRTLKIEDFLDGDIEEAKLGSVVAFLTLIGAIISVYQSYISEDDSLNITDIEEFIV